jgi:cytochrome c oxidase subunit 2
MGRAALVLGILALSACGGDEAAKPAAAPDDAAERQQRVVQVDDEAGATLYRPCAACHGDDGGGIAQLNAPSLVALDPWYLERQLEAFQLGYRGTHPDDTYGAQMRPLVAGLSARDRVQLAAYIDRLPDAPAPATIEGDLVQGKDYYQMVCGSCHGPRAEGNDLLGAPALAGTDDWYLLRQFQYFRGGIRGRAEGDRWGYQMVMMAPALPDEQVTRNVIAYINSLAE